MRIKAWALCCILAGTPCYGAPLLNEPLAELKLEDGSVLHDAVVKGYFAASVMVKHRGGAQTVPYEQFPAEYREVLLAKRPDKPAALTPAAKPAMTKAKPLSKPSLILQSARFEGEIGVVEIFNDSGSEAFVHVGNLVGEMGDQTRVEARQFVSVDEAGRITATLSRIQPLKPYESTELRVSFAKPPPGSAFARILWNRQ